MDWKLSLAGLLIGLLVGFTGMGGVYCEDCDIAELNDEFRQLTAHVLRMARYRLGLC